jgi:Fusaric acid resistance protein-like
MTQWGRMDRWWRPGALAGRLRGLVPVWSRPAALRALRATLVIPGVFALTFKVFRDPQMALFASFGGIGALVMTSFGGSRQDKAVAHLSLAVVGSVTLIIGTVANSPAWLAVVVTIPVAFAVYAAGSAGPNAASAVTACLLAYVLPIASAGGTATLPSRLAGWWLAQAASTLAVLLLSPRPPGDRLRADAGALAGALATRLEAALGGGAMPDGPQAASREKIMATKKQLRDTFIAGPYRPIGLAAADLSMANLVHLLEWCADQVIEATDGRLNLATASEPDRALLTVSARALSDVASVLSDRHSSVALREIWQARLTSAEHLQRLSGDAANATADVAFFAQAIGIAAGAALGDARIAARVATPAAIAAERERWQSGLRADEVAPAGQPQASRGNAVPSARLVATDAPLRTVWFRNSARGAIALAAAVAVAKVTNVEHAFWVVLGTLSVLRTSAAATGTTALRALAGTIAGFVVGGALLVAIGTNPIALWAIYPCAVLVAAYTPGTAAFAVGQAAFTILVVVLFNILVPAGWKVGLLRVEDIALGCAVSLVVGFLFWPRGASGVVGDDLADAFRVGTSYLDDAAGWALGDRERRPDRVVAAIATGARLDDAIRGYLTEQGSKRLSKADLWQLVMASERLRLTAHSMASLPAKAAPHDDDSGLHAALRQQEAGLSRFYDALAAQVDRPTRAAPAPVPVEPPSGLRLDGTRPGPAGEPDALWVGRHLDDLAAHAADVTGPAERLALIRRRPWWR